MTGQFHFLANYVYMYTYSHGRTNYDFYIGLPIQSICTLPRCLKPKVGAYDCRWGGHGSSTCPINALTICTKLGPIVIWRHWQQHIHMRARLRISFLRSPLIITLN